MVSCYIKHLINKTSIIKIITKTQVAFFVMIFLFSNMGFVITRTEIRRRDFIYSLEEKYIVAKGRVDNISTTEYGWNLELRDVQIKDAKSKKAQIEKAQIENAQLENAKLNDAQSKKTQTENVKLKNAQLKKTQTENARLKKTQTENVKLKDAQLKEVSCSKIIVSCSEESQVRIGNIIEVRGQLRQFESPSNKGNFDSKRYYMSLGIYIKIKSNNITIIDERYNVLKGNLAEMRIFIQKELQEICGKNSYGIWSLCRNKDSIFSAILLGEKSELDDDLRNLYSMSGISHILAISGLHISCIGMFIYSLTRKKCGFGTSALVSMLVVVGFGTMSGLGITTMRAMVMFGLQLLGQVWGRKYDALTALSVAAIIILIGNPFAIYNSGFQLSFGAIIAIVVVWPMLCNIFQICDKKVEIVDEGNTTKEMRRKIILCNMKNRILTSLLFCININLVLNPIIAFSYYQLPTYSFALNVIVVPLMTVVIVSGIVGIGLKIIIGTFLGKIAIVPGCIVLESYTLLCNIINKIPFSNVIVGQPSVESIIIYYLIIGIFLLVGDNLRNIIKQKERLENQNISTKGQRIENSIGIKYRKKRINRRFVIVGLVVILVLQLIIYGYYTIFNYGLFNRDKLLISFLDVGQGDGIFIRCCDGTTIMVDGGSSSIRNVGEKRIIPALKSRAIKRIDYIIVTHADTDHVSGIKELLDESDNNGIKIRNLVMPDINLKDDNYMELINLAASNDVSVRYIYCGNRMDFGKVRIRCIYPDIDSRAYDRNDYSTVLSLCYGDFSMLLTGDISTKPETAIGFGKEKNYTVLKVPHHGSNYSTSKNLLEKIKPLYSIISVGKDNVYGHPGAELMNRLRECNTEILRTDESGEILIKTDGRKMNIEKMRNNE